MPTYRLDLAYDGTDFHGFAKQPGLRTVQGELEEALTHHSGPVETFVAGRTDKGVHATGQVVSFVTGADLEVDRVVRSLNSQLSAEVAVIGLVRVGDDFHARFSAEARAYRYDIVNRPVPDPLRARTAWHVAEPLDLEAMNEAAEVLVGEHDFASFCRRGEGQSTIRTVLWAGWHDWSHVVELSIAANAFCHQMVRSIVAVLVEVGRSRLEVDDIEPILEAVDRNQARGTAPPHGLALVAIAYPGERFEPPEWLDPDG